MEERISLTQLRLLGTHAEVELSSHEKPLLIPLEEAHRFRLVEGTVLTPAQVTQLETEAERFAARRETTRLLALRPHSVEELRLKLRKKQFGEEVIGEVIRDFKERGMLDDAQYAHMLAESLVRRKPCGRGYLISYLQDKRIDRFLAADAADAVLAEYNQDELAVRALRSRWREFGQFDLETAQRKAYNYLARRGFSFEATRAAFQILASESTDGGNN